MHWGSFLIEERHLRLRLEILNYKIIKYRTSILPNQEPLCFCSGSNWNTDHPYCVTNNCFVSVWVATEIQNIQIADGDICRNLPIPIYMIFPRLFTCPTLHTNNFKIGMIVWLKCWSVEVQLHCTLFAIDGWEVHDYVLNIIAPLLQIVMLSSEMFFMWWVVHCTVLQVSDSDIAVYIVLMVRCIHCTVLQVSDSGVQCTVLQASDSGVLCPVLQVYDRMLAVSLCLSCIWPCGGKCSVVNTKQVINSISWYDVCGMPVAVCMLFWVFV